MFEEHQAGDESGKEGVGVHQPLLASGGEGHTIRSKDGIQRGNTEHRALPGDVAGVEGQ